MKNTLIAVVLMAAGNAGAATLFSQNFDSGGVLADYVNAAAPNSGQWNGISSSGAAKTWTVDSGRLRFDSIGANAAYASRTTAFPMPVATVMVAFRMDFISSASTATSAFQFLLGSGFDTNNSLPSAAATHSKFGLNFGADNTFQVRDVSNGQNGVATFGAGSYQITFVSNNSGGAMSYLAPDGTTESLGNDAWDLWVGTSRQLDERPATTAGVDLSNLKFGSSTNGSFSLAFDNLQIVSLPEPGTAMLACIGLVGMLRRRRIR